MLEQSACALQQLNSLFDAYKSLGIYDNSVMVVTSDHGARVFNEHHINGFPSQFELNASGVFFMIKGLNQRAPFKQVNQPFSLLKLKEALLEPEQHVSDYSQMRDEKRLFYAYLNWHDSKQGYLPDAPMYEVGPQYRDVNSWQFQGFMVNNCEPQDLPIKMTFNTTGREGYCGTFGFNKPSGSGRGSWTVGHDSRVVFRASEAVLDTDGVRTLRLKFWPSEAAIREGLELNIYLNDQLIGKEPIVDQGMQTVVVNFPVNLMKPSKNVLQIQLPGILSAHETQQGNSPVRFGLLIQSIELN